MVGLVSIETHQLPGEGWAVNVINKQSAISSFHFLLKPLLFYTHKTVWGSFVSSFSLKLYGCASNGFFFGYAYNVKCLRIQDYKRIFR